MAAAATRLKAIVSQLERGERAAAAGDQARVHRELLEVAREWPEAAAAEGGELADKLMRQLAKFTEAQQEELVGGCRPLRDFVRQRMGEATTALNRWLGDAQDPPDKASVPRLTELLQGLDGAPWFRLFRQCPEVPAKAAFVLAVANVLRALTGEAAPLRSMVAAHPRAVALVQRVLQKLFVVPKHGNVLVLWHNGRLLRYNRTLWRAARRAAERLRDELQVRLVSALRRATASAQVPGGKSKPVLQLELRAWPMCGCPLAKSFLDFVAQRGRELGDLGKPTLSECPPHSLQPQTLRRLLSRLDAFELLENEKQDKGERLPIVRLRWQAVAALAHKAVGTKPKAAAQAAAVAAAAGLGGGKGGSAVDVPKASAAATPAKAGKPASKALAAPGAAAANGNGAAAGEAAKLVQRKMDWGNAATLLRIVRRGLRAGDEEWRTGWQAYCKQKRLPAELAQGSHTKDALAEFLERNQSKLLKQDWARDLMYKAEGASDALPADSDAEDGRGGAGGVPAPGGGSDGGRGDGCPPGSRKRVGSRSQDSSSASDSSRSKRRRRRKDRKRKHGMMGYPDYFARGQKDMLPREVMMMNQMNQMMGMSMMMNNPLATMMGMSAPMLTPGMPMLPGGLKGGKKDDKLLKRGDKPEEKGKPAARDAPRDRERSGGDRKVGPNEPGVPASGERAVERAATAAPGAAAPAAGGDGKGKAAAPAEGGKAPAKEGKVDWSKRKEAMIDADDL